MYYSISILLCGNSSMFQELKTRTAYTLIEKREEFKKLYEFQENFDIKKEISDAFTNYSWAGEAQILALAQMVQRDIIVLHSHVDKLKGKCPLSSCVQKHGGMHTHYLTQTPRDSRKLLVLFSPMRGEGKEQNHFTPLLKLKGKPDHPSLSQISNKFQLA